MKNTNELQTSKELIETIMSALQLTKKQLAASLGCTQAQLNVLIKRVNEKPTKTTKLQRDLLVIHNICSLSKGHGVGELRRRVTEAFSDTGRDVTFED